MPIQNLIAKAVLTDKQADELAGEFLDSSHYSVLIDRDADVYREDGTALLHFRKSAVPDRHAIPAFHALLEAATSYGNRGIAAGKMKYHLKGDEEDKRKATQGRPNLIGAGDEEVRFKYKKKDGTVSKTNLALTVPSGIIGGFDRNPRYPYCRLTKFTADHPERIAAAMPFIRAVDSVFATNSPERYANQKAACARTHPDYVFQGTAFTTITVNKNWRTAAHKDAGDLRSGFGVLSVLSEGRYSGGYFVIPKYGVAVDMRHADVLLADVHEWHGNTELVGVSRYWTRLSTVHYFRSKMVGCKSLTEELQIAKRRVEGTPMFGDFTGEFPE